jgi:hypothetical protein
MVLALAGICLFGVVPLSAQLTSNVFVVVIDGVRDTEAFEDPSHQFIPHIWNSLRPQGAVYTDLQNWGITATTAGHNVIVSGFRDISPNASLGDYYGRPKHPTFFEYYRQARGVPIDKVWLVTGKRFVHQADYSLDPSYGQAYRARVDSNAFGYTDMLVWEELQSIMDQHHPSLVMVNLPEVDAVAHDGDWDSYTSAISQADSIVYALWQKIQANSAYNPAYTDTTYRNKTTLLVTTDHGRHDDTHGGFADHGGICHGCRHTMFLAVGPGIRQGLQLNALRLQEDICPTVGSLLGFTTPFAEGRALSEMLTSFLGKAEGAPVEEPGATSEAGETRLTTTSSRSADPQLFYDDGTVHVVWVDDESGHPEVYYRRSTNRGGSWRSVQQLSQSGYGAIQPAVWASSGDVHVTWIDYRRDGEGNPNPQIYYRRSTNDGESWQQEHTLASSIYERAPRYRAIGLWSPALSGYWNSVSLGAAGENSSVGVHYSNDGGDTWNRSVADRSCYFVPSLDLCRDHSSVQLAWSDTRDLNLEIYHSRSTNGGTSWGSPTRISDGISYSNDPSITVRNDDVAAVWGEVSSGVWKVYCRRSSNDGRTWGNTEVLNTVARGSWYPDAAWGSSGLRVVWTDYRDGSAQVYSRFQYSGTDSWSPEVRETSGTGGALKPQVTPEGYCVWMDRRDGNWEIYYKELDALH